MYNVTGSCSTHDMGADVPSAIHMHFNNQFTIFVNCTLVFHECNTFKLIAIPIGIV